MRLNSEISQILGRRPPTPPETIDSPTPLKIRKVKRARRMHSWDASLECRRPRTLTNRTPEEVLWTEIEFPEGGRDACVEPRVATNSGYAHRPKPTFAKYPAVEGYHYLAVCADDTGLNTATERDDEGNEYVEMLFPYEYAKLILDAPPPEESCARLRV